MYTLNSSALSHHTLFIFRVAAHGTPYEEDPDEVFHHNLLKHSNAVQ